jgi:hypothetical protein
MEKKCIVCGWGSQLAYHFVGNICRNCFKDVGGRVCCICGKKIREAVAHYEYWDYGLTKRGEMMNSFPGLLCDSCVSNMVRCRKCGLWMFSDEGFDYRLLGTGKATGEKICFKCYTEDFVACTCCSGTIQLDVDPFWRDIHGKVICHKCKELAQE